MSKIDWIKIKNEYINTNISQRKLAEKYNISVTTVSNRAKADSWADLKKERLYKTGTKVVQKTAEKIAEKEVERITKVLSLADKITPKIEKAIEQLEVVGEIVDTYKLRQVVQSVKDLKEIVKTDNNNIESLKKLDEVLGTIKGNI